MVKEEKIKRWVIWRRLLNSWNETYGNVSKVPVTWEKTSPVFATEKEAKYSAGFFHPSNELRILPEGVIPNE